jgi:hypothetical protein
MEEIETFNNYYLEEEQGAVESMAFVFTQYLINATMG